MRKHSKEFKEKIALLGKEQSIQISFGETVLSNSEINEVYRIVNGNILKSVMREIEIDSNVEIPLKTQINVKYGILVNEEYEYLNLGNFIVNKVERQEDTYSYLIKCYDKMLYTMQDYKTPNVLFPVTIKQYITGLCENLGLVFKQRNYKFTNSNKILQTDPYENIGYKYRDVFDDLAEVTASTICINEDDDELELRNITDAKYTNTLQGTFLTLTDSKEDTIKVNRILSDSTQETEPTPENSIEIESVGDNINIFDEKIVLGSINTSTGENQYNNDFARTVNYIDVNGIKDISLQYKNNKATAFQIVVYQYDSNKTFIKYTAKTQTQYSLTLEENTKYIRARFRGVSSGAIEDYQNIKIEKGLKATPYTPYGMGSVEIKVSNANLLPNLRPATQTINGVTLTNNGDGTYYLDGTPTAYLQFVDSDAFILKKGNYTLYGNVNIQLKSKDGLTTYVTTNANSSKSFTFEKDTEVRFRQVVYATEIYSNKLIKPMLISGTNQIDFIEHQSQEMVFPIQEEMLKGDYLDFENNVEHHEWLKVIVDKNTTITYQGTNTSGLYRYLIYVSDNYAKNVKKCDTKSAIAYCNRLTLLANGQTYACIQGFTVNNNIIYIYTDGGSLDNFKTYLAENPMTFYLPLQETDYYDLPFNELQVEKAEEIKNAKAYNDLTHISSDGMAILDVTYTTEFEEIDEHYLKDVNVNFGKKYGKINSLVLSRSESDNIYRQDNKSIEENGLNELKISDNVIMNNNERSDYIDAIFNKINGLEYYLNDFTSTGLMYLDLLDRYKVNIGENQYSCVLLNNEQNISQGLEELIFTEEPETTVTDYSKADKTDLKINQTNLIVDKQGQQIQGLITNVTNISEKQTEIIANVEGLTTKVSDIEDVTKEATGIKTITLENCVAGTLLELQIKGNNTVFERLFPSTTLYANTDVFPKGDSRIKVTSGENVDIYDLGVAEVLRQNGTVYDEYILSEGIAQVIRRIDSSGNILANPTISVLGEFGIQLYEGTNIIEIVNYEASMTATYAIKNAFTDVFATRVDMSSKIESTAQEINLEVSKKVDENEIIAKINLSAESASINANRVSLKRKSY